MVKPVQIICRFVLPALLFSALMATGCKQQSPTPQATTTAQPTEASVPISPLSSPGAPVSPLAWPTPGTQPTLPAQVTGPLSDYTINYGMYADYIDLPYYGPLTWTGITWDGGAYIWIVNDEFKALVGYNIEKATNDRLVPFPTDLPITPTVTGLAWDGSSFWLSDLANKMIYQVDAITGKRKTGFAYDGMPNGMDWAEGALWVLSKERKAIEKVGPTGEQLLSWPIDVQWPSGLAWDGTHFWYSDGHSGTISILNPASGKSKMVDEINFMGNRGAFNSMAWMNGYLWVATEGDQRLHRFDVSQLDWKTLDAVLQ